MDDQSIDQAIDKKTNLINKIKGKAKSVSDAIDRSINRSNVAHAYACTHLTQRHHRCVYVFISIQLTRFCSPFFDQSPSSSVHVPNHTHTFTHLHSPSPHTSVSLLNVLPCFCECFLKIRGKVRKTIGIPKTFSLHHSQSCP